MSDDWTLDRIPLTCTRVDLCRRRNKGEGSDRNELRVKRYTIVVDGNGTCCHKKCIDNNENKYDSATNVRRIE